MSATSLLPFVGDIGRRWTIEIQSDKRPLTVNAVNNMHYMAWANTNKKNRGLWNDVIRGALVPHLEQIVVVVTPLHKDRRSPQDPAACAPAAKAAIDGTVDAGVIDDDNGSHLLAVSFLPPEVIGSNGLRLTIYEVIQNERHLVAINDSPECLAAVGRHPAGRVS